MPPEWLKNSAACHKVWVESGGVSATMGCAMSSKILFALLLVGFLAGTAWTQEEKKPEEKAPSQPAAAAQAPEPAHAVTITPEDVARKNPVKLTQNSVERGKKTFASQCAMCHGAKGDGKGELAEEMKINPPDFTKPDALKKRTDGEWFAILGQGSEPMQGQGSRMNPRQKWDLVNYLRSLGGAPVARSAPNEPEENVVLVPQ
jgi:mono/diheme cytochrome c family protein